MKKIFITGGAGFIGSNLVKKIIELNNVYYENQKILSEIIIYDNLATVNCGIDNINEYIIKNKVTFIKGDILDKDLLIKSMSGVDVVIHLAAQLEVTKSYNDSLYDLNINLIGTINVMQACIACGVKRLINASSACVYGFTFGMPSKETDATNPNWEYGISKMAAEKYLQIASATNELDITSLRFSIVYGRNEWYGRVLTIFTKRALQGKDLVIFGDGMQKRDYINVEDVCDFILECVINPNTINKIYNVSSGYGISINQLANTIKNIFININIIYEDVQEGSKSKIVEGRERLSQELKYLILDNSKAITETNWKPKITFDKGLNEYIEWVKHNLDKWHIYKV